MRPTGGHPGTQDLATPVSQALHPDLFILLTHHFLQRELNAETANIPAQSGPPQDLPHSAAPRTRDTGLHTAEVDPTSPTLGRPSASTALHTPTLQMAPTALQSGTSTFPISLPASQTSTFAGVMELSQHTSSTPPVPSPSREDHAPPPKSNPPSSRPPAPLRNPLFIPPQQHRADPTPIFPVHNQLSATQAGSPPVRPLVLPPRSRPAPANQSIVPAVRTTIAPSADSQLNSLQQRVLGQTTNDYVSTLAHCAPDANTASIEDLKKLKDACKHQPMFLTHRKAKTDTDLMTS